MAFQMLLIHKFALCCCLALAMSFIYIPRTVNILSIYILSGWYSSVSINEV